MLASMTTTFSGVAETLLHETAVRLRALWGFGCGDGARAGMACRLDAQCVKHRIDVVDHRADFGRFRTALQSPCALRRGGLWVMPVSFLISAEAD